MFSAELQDLISPAFNDDVLLTVLRKESGHEQVEIKKVQIRATATNKGDSYLSSIVRFSVLGINLERYEHVESK